MRLTTKYGDIDVTVQSHDTAYVRAGTGDQGDSTESLTLPRGIVVHGRDHYRLTDGTWQPDNAWTSFFKRGQYDDMTAHQRDTLRAVIIEALTSGITPAMLHDAGREKANGEAVGRRATAAKLRECADALDREAAALEDGGVAVYMENSYQGGYSDTTRHVRTAAGELLPAVPEPPTVYGAAKYPASHVRDTNPSNAYGRAWAQRPLRRQSQAQALAPTQHPRPTASR